MPRKKYPTVELIRQCLREEDGKLYWLKRPREHFKTLKAYEVWNARLPGKEAGSWREKRWIIVVFNCPIYRHLVVWALHHGEWPGAELDHKNRNSGDDRIGNLRLATHSQNQANQTISKHNTSGYKGVTFNKQCQKWIARCRQEYLGMFHDPLLAHQAYMKAARERWGIFASDGK